MFASLRRKGGSVKSSCRLHLVRRQLVHIPTATSCVLLVGRALLDSKAGRQASVPLPWLTCVCVPSGRQNRAGRKLLRCSLWPTPSPHARKRTSSKLTASRMSANHGGIKVFSGTSHPELAQLVAKR